MFKNNKSYKIKYITALLFILVIGYSCDDIIDELPISEVSPLGFYKTNDDIQAAVIGVYDVLQGTYRENNFYWGELRSDNHEAFSSGSTSLNRVEVVNNDITQGNGAARWNNLYRIIDRANLVLENAPNVSGLNTNFIAETLALRAKAYFDAVRVWGNVPLFVTSVRTLEEAVKPVTDGATILNDVVIPDMLRAAELMTIPTSNFRFSKASIYALQAEVYMWLKEYPKAKIALDNLFLLGGHSLVTTPEAWEDLFYNSPAVPSFPLGRGKIQKGSELILSIRYDLLESRDFGGRRNNRSGTMGLYFSGIPSYVLSPEIENKWREKFPVVDTLWTAKYPNTNPALTKIVQVDDGMGGLVEEEQFVYGDWRYFYSRAEGINIDSAPIGFARTAKWQKTNYSPDFDDTDIVLYRYADMILLLAEAENQINADGVKALELVNQIRTARQLPLVTSTEFGATKEDRINYILDERQLELFGEGKRWWDLVRNNKAIEILNPIILARNAGGTELTADRLVWPIFETHLLENPLLDQNIGYKN